MWFSVQPASWQWCQTQPWLPYGKWIHGSSGAPTNGLGPVYLDLWVTLPPAISELWPLTWPWSLYICLFLLVLSWTKNLSLKFVLSQFSAMWTSTEANRKQTCKPFSFDELWWVFYSRLNIFSVGSSKRLVYGRCSCVKALHTVVAEQQYPKWSHYGCLPVAQASLVVSQPPLGASTLGNTYSLAVILLLANNIVGF